MRRAEYFSWQMKSFCLYTLWIITLSAHTHLYGADKYWVGISMHDNNFNTAADLSQWELADDNGTGSWSLTAYGTAILRMDGPAGGFANRLFHVSGGLPRLLPLDKVNGLVSFQVIALSAGQQFYLQVQEFNASGTSIGQQTILAPQSSRGSFSVNLSGVTWNSATTQIRFILAGENLSVQQGTVEFNYFSYTTAGGNNRWSNSLNWSATPGGTGGAGVPGISDRAIFDGNSGFNAPCMLTSATTVAGISMIGYTGTVDLRGFSLTSISSNTFSSGDVANAVASGTLNFNSGSGSTTTFAGTSFNAAISGSAGSILFNGSYFNNSVILQKTGTMSSTGQGGNTFQATVTLTNAASGEWVLANSSPDLFNGPLTLFVASDAAASIDLAYASGGNQFNDHITFTYNIAGAINFGRGGGTSTLADGKTISVTTPCSGNCGSLSLAGVTTGANAQNITFSTGGTFSTALASVWNGDLTVSAASVLLEGSIFNGATSLTKSGSSVDSSIGGNEFNGTTTITNIGTGTFRMADVNGDNYNGDVTFVRSGGVVEPAYNGPNLFTANIETNSSSPITFGAGGGTVTLFGANAQRLKRSGTSASPIINRLAMFKSAEKLTLDASLTVGVSALLLSGIIDAPSPYYVQFANSATVSFTNHASHIDGLVRKTGLSDFVFPVGDDGVYRPITISALVISSVFAAQFIKTPQTLGDAKVGTLAKISACEYWSLNRESGLSTPFVTITWQSDQCSANSYVTQPSDLRVACWNGSFWDDYSTSGFLGNAAAGSVSTASNVQSFGQFALASATADNPLPVTLDKFKGVASKDEVALFWETASELNNDYFTVLRSSSGLDFEEIGVVKGAGTTSLRQHYVFHDKQPLQERSYYRLKQTDFDKQVEYSGLIMIDPVVTVSDNKFFHLHPNPAGQEWITFSEPTAFRIVNAVGQPVLAGDESTGFDASALPAGIYWVFSGSRETAKLVIH